MNSVFSFHSIQAILSKKIVLDLELCVMNTVKVNVDIETWEYFYWEILLWSIRWTDERKWLASSSTNS